MHQDKRFAIFCKIEQWEGIVFFKMKLNIIKLRYNVSLSLYR